MTESRHLHAVAPERVRKDSKPAQLGFGMPDHPLARTRSDKDVAIDLERIRQRLIAKGGIGR